MLLIVVSPAKKLDFETESIVPSDSKPTFLNQTDELAKELKKLKPAQIAKMMGLSQNLTQLNFERFQAFSFQGKSKFSKPAGYAFNGDTYTGLDFNSFTQTEVKRAQKQLRILSGLYGILKPLDLIQAYRLEMGTKIKGPGFKNLYDFWSEQVTEQLNQQLKAGDFLVNCASQEYFKVINTQKLQAKVITPIFKENRNGTLKIISFNAKRARGMMARYIIKEKINSPNELKKFDLDGYKFNAKESNDEELVFVR